MADRSSAPDATARVAASAPASTSAFQRVIVPLDGSEVAEKALEYGQEIARRFSATLVLLRAFEGAEQSTRMWATMPADPVSGAVDPNTYQLIEEGAAAAKQSARAYLDEKAKALNDAGIAVDTVMVDDAPADAIIAEATHGSGPLVVMCTHGRGGISRLVFGSTAQDVLKRIKTSLLLVRVYEDADITREGAAMDIRIGADVVGTEGKLGVVDKVVVDARTDAVTDLVVKHGRFSGRERIVNLSHVTAVENGVVKVNLDERDFESMDGYSDDRYRAPDPNYSGPPGFNNQDYLMDVTVAEGPMMGLAGGPSPVLGFPGGNQVSPDDNVRPTVAPGTHVMDSLGEKIGEVHEIFFDSSTGAPTHMVVRSGWLFHRDTEIPGSLIKDVAEDGILLTEPKSEIEKLHGAQR